VEAQLTRAGRGALVLVLSTAYFWYVFQFSDGTFTRAGLGDWLDPYFINLLMEHWYTSLVRLSNPTSLPIYYPTTGVLGYSHALILYAPFYIVFRPFADPFQAWTLALFVILVLGTSCVYAVLRRCGVQFAGALVLTACFVTSPNVISNFTGTFSQTASIFLVPMIALLALHAAGMRARRWRAVMIGVTAFLLVLLFTQEFYTAVFLFLVAALFGVGLVPWSRIARAIGRITARAAAAFRVHAAADRQPNRVWSVIGLVAAVLALAIAVYPLERTEILGRSFSARDPWRPGWIAVAAGGWYAWWRWNLGLRLTRLATSLRADLLRGSGAVASSAAWRWTTANVAVVAASGVGAIAGAAVFLWIYFDSFLRFRSFPRDHLFDRLHQPDPARWSGVAAMWRDLWGYESGRPLFLLVVVVALAWLPAFRVPPGRRRFALWCLVVAGVVVAIPIRVGEFSFWTAWFGWAPGLTVVRDPTRVIYLFELAVAAVVGVMISGQAKPVFRAAVLATACLLMVTDWDDRVFPMSRARSAFARFVDEPIAIDRTCRSFFIADASRRYESRHNDSNLWGLYGIDSGFIALKYGIPTLNGYSAWQPNAWGLQEPHGDSYMAGVDAWIARHGLRNVCRLDIDERRMTRYRPGAR
jgi:hypothetical protein